MVVCGVAAPNASVLMYGKVGYGWPHHPVTGFIAFVPGAGSRAFFKSWWDVHDGKFGFAHAYEQFGLWALMEPPLRLGSGSLCVHNRGQMAHADPDGFVKHWGSDRGSDRVRELTAVLGQLVGAGAAVDLEARVGRVADTQTEAFDPADVAAEVAAVPGPVPSALMPPSWVG